MVDANYDANTRVNPRCRLHRVPIANHAHNPVTRWRSNANAHSYLVVLISANSHVMGAQGQGVDS